MGLRVAPASPTLFYDGLGPPRSGEAGSKLAYSKVREAFGGTGEDFRLRRAPLASILPMVSLRWGLLLWKAMVDRDLPVIGSEHAISHRMAPAGLPLSNVELKPGI